MKPGSQPLPESAPPLVGISGKSRSGKDTVARVLVSRYKGVAQVSFSDGIIEEANDWLRPLGREITEANKSMPMCRGGAAGLTLVSDLESGYFCRQLSMPLSRTAIVFSAMCLGAIQCSVQSLLIIGIGLALGASPATGALGLLALLLFALLWGLGFAGYSVATGLKTGTPQAAQAATFIFFPLMFLAPVFLPKDQLAPWIQAIATVNPTTYMLEGMRSLMIDGWVFSALGKALLAGGLFALLTLSLAAFVARRATRG